MEKEEPLMIGIGGEIDKHLKGFTFLVTGGTGFLGVHVIKLVCKNHHDVFTPSSSVSPPPFSI
jgi:nucleoside-diphosphate-sugar epimerase